MTEPDDLVDSRPRCPKCGNAEDVARLAVPVTGQAWECAACPLVFEGTIDEWTRFVDIRLGERPASPNVPTVAERNTGRAAVAGLREQLHRGGRP